MDSFFHLIEIAVVLNAFLVLIRLIKGPYLPDRIISVNVISTKVVVLMALLANVSPFVIPLDVAFVYSLILFATNVALARYLETGVLDV